MVICLECGTENDFNYMDGTGYCNVCGIQSQDIREEVVEINEGELNNPRLEVARGLNSSKAAVVPEQFWTVVEAAQFILLIQAKSLVNQGFSLSLLTHIGNLWFKFLAYVGEVKVCGWEKKDLSVKKYAIHMDDHIALIFIGLHLNGETVLLSELLRFILNGILPYINTYKFLPSRFKPISALPQSLKQHSFPTILDIKKSVSRVSDILDLKFSPLSDSKLIDISTRISNHYKIPDVYFCKRMVNFLKRAYQEPLQDPSLVNVSFAVATVYTLRAYFQFEDPNTVRKESWVTWLREYLSINSEQICETYSRVKERKQEVTCEDYYTCHTVTRYLDIVDGALPHYLQVQKTLGDFDELSRLFLGLEAGSPTEGGLHNEREMIDKKLEQSKNVLRDDPILIYPTDEYSTLPLEFRLILMDVSRNFFEPHQSIFKKLQRLLKRLKTRRIKLM